MKKLILLLAIIVIITMIASFSVAGCKKEAVSSETVTVESTAAEETTTTTGIETTQTTTEKKPEEYSATVIVVVSSAATPNALIPYFNQTYPNIKINVVAIPYAELLQKFKTALASGTELPDIMWLEMGFRGEAIALDVWENLEAAPYNFDRTTVFDYLYPLITNTRDEVVGIDWSSTISGIAYNRLMAQEYFGTEDPSEMEKLLPDWDTFIQKGVEIKNKSGKFMLSTEEDVLAFTIGQNPNEYVTNGTLNFNAAIAPTLQMVIKMRDAGIMDVNDIWSPGYFASYTDDKHMFFNFPTWMLQTLLKQDTERTDTWRLMKAPGGGYAYGGTCWSIPKDSKNKLEAYKFIEWYLLSPEGSRLNKDISGNLSTVKAMYQEPGFAEIKYPQLFGDQNLSEKWFTDIAPTTKVKGVSEYDNVILTELRAVLSQIRIMFKIDFNKASDMLKEAYSAKLPDLTIN
ncbi:MAG: extracellular solute-binding protein [Actinobacteria bacterium]|nr:extracellular solute-binding protein [Actinomycetota bacterium]